MTAATNTDWCPPIQERYPREILPTTWANAEVTILGKRSNEKKRLEIIDLRTGTRYRHEPMNMTACKCALLWLAVPLYGIAFFFVHLIRTPIEAIRNRSLSVLTEGISKIVKAPFYILAMELSAIYGVFKPLEGRKHFAYYENKLHNRTDLTASKPDYYLAPCMQPKVRSAIQIDFRMIQDV